VSLLVDTCVWSLAFRLDRRSDEAAVARLRDALAQGETIYTTGLVLQELVQGFADPKARASINERFAALPGIVPSRDDHIAAAEIRNRCRRNGVQVGTIDALLIQLCLHHDLVLLTEDRDFFNAAEHCPLRLWHGDPTHGGDRPPRLSR
jgi:predicted nucleic acid-binding protein